MIQRWWPTTQALDLVQGSVEEVARAVHAELSRFSNNKVSGYWESFLDLDDMFGAVKKFTNPPTEFFVIPTYSKWTVLWNNSFLCDGYSSLCWNLTRNHGLTTIHWSAHDEWTTFQSGATFSYRRSTDQGMIERYVQAYQEDKRWIFHSSGEPLAEENLKSYGAKRKRDRLNEAGISEILSRLGAYPWQEQFYAIPRH